MRYFLEMRCCALRRYVFLSCIVCSIAALTCPLALAAKTERWGIETAKDFSAGTRNRLSITQDGMLRMGYASTNLGDFAKEIWCSAVDEKGNIYFSTGSPADLYRVGKDRSVTLLMETDAVAITAMAIDPKGSLFVATIADGKLYKIDNAGEAEGKLNKKEHEFCRLGSPYIWDMVIDKEGRLFVATGPAGRIYRISAEGKPEKWFTAEETSVMSLALAEDGALYAGGGSRGLLYRIAAKDQGSVLHEFPGDEVKGVVIVGDDIYVGVNEKAATQRNPNTVRKHAAAFESMTDELIAGYDADMAIDIALDNENGPRAGGGGAGLSGVLYVRHKDGLVEKVSEWNGQTVLDMVQVEEGSVLLAMANKGNIYRVTKERRWELVFDSSTKDVMTLAVHEGRLVFVGTGNVGEAHVVESDSGVLGEFISVVRDCRFRTTWGELSWRGKGVKLSTRTGNTLIPDTAWSAWSQPLAVSPKRIQSPVARYLQVRATLDASMGSELTEITAYFTSQNQKPQVSSVEVQRKRSAFKAMIGGGAKALSGPSQKSSKPSKERKAEALAAKAEQSPEAGRESRMISWSAEDQDGDTLVYRLFYREAEDDTDDAWVPMPIVRPLHATEYMWDAETVPDGRYRIKVSASDEKSNPVGQFLSGDRESRIVIVDNRRPLVEDLAYDRAKGHLSGVARDSSSLIRRIEYSVDGGEWQLASPLDGVFDNMEEQFVIQLGDDGAAHWVAVRVMDEEGNVGVERLKVEKKVE